jgi:hypothetical protein
MVAVVLPLLLAGAMAGCGGKSAKTESSDGTGSVSTSTTQGNAGEAAKARLLLFTLPG